MNRVMVLCTVLLLLTSCGGDDSQDTATTEAGGSETTAVDTTAGEEPSTGAVVAIEVDPCTLLTADEVESATGLTVTAVAAQGAITCVFDLGAEAGVDVFITVDDAAGRMTSPSAVYADYVSRVGDGKAEAIEDVGATAVYDSGFRAIAVDAGEGKYFVVGVNGGYQQLEDPRDALIVIARAASARL